MHNYQFHCESVVLSLETNCDILETGWLDHWHGQTIWPLGQECERPELEAAALVVLLPLQDPYLAADDPRHVHRASLHACRDPIGRLRHGQRFESLDSSISAVVYRHFHSEMPRGLENWLSRPHDGAMQRDLDISM